MSPEDLNELKADLKEIRKDISEHMRRTEIAELRLDASEILLTALAADMRPLTIAAAMWAGAHKVLVVLGVLVGLAVGVYKLLGH